MPMSLKEEISKDFTKAFKEKDLAKKEVLSMMLSEIKNKEIELGKRDQGLSDEEVFGVLLRAIKQRKDSVEQFRQGGREELAQKEQSEINILQTYLPEQLSDQQIEAEVQKAIEQAKTQGEINLGKVMGLSMNALKGKADGNKVREIVSKLLAQE